MFAEIAVYTPMARRLPVESESASDEQLGLTFHYAVPGDLLEELQPGHLVWVPFGRQQLQGVVLALVERLPAGVERARHIIDLVMPEPVCTPAQIELARWLSHTYLAPVLDCLLLMLPPGLAQKAEPVLWPTRLALQILAGSASPGARSETGPSGENSGVGRPSPQQLAFASDDFALASRPAGPYLPQFPDLKPEQHALLALLLERKQVPVRVLEREQPDLLRGSVLDPLIQRGLVNRQRRIVEPSLKAKTGRQVALIANQETVHQVLPGLGRKSKQADALAWLAGHAELPPTISEICQAVGCSVSPVKSLAERGWIEIDGDKRVTLLVPANQVPERLIELRGGEKYRVVLDALAGEAGPVWIGWLYAETGADLATLRDLAEAGLISLDEVEVWRDPLAGKEFVADTPPPLTEDQAKVWREIELRITNYELRIENSETTASEIRNSKFAIQNSQFLLHGVTGSGKTEIYLRAIAETLKAGRQAIVLVPEIALTPQTVRRFAARFGEKVTIYHSDLSAGERYDVWRKARSSDISVVVGTRSALFLPLPSIGLIVLDEEHDPSFKEAMRPPRFHAREAALHLAGLTGATLILGSATPALETYYAAQLGRLQLLELPRRIMGHAKAIAEQQKKLHLRQTVYRPVDALHQEARYAELPPVEIVDLRQELRAGNRSMFSRSLQAAMDQVLAAGQQAILFFNRRGTATFVICRDCGHVLHCEQCDVPLTYHESRGGRAVPQTAASREGELICHHCGRRYGLPERCPKCDSRRIRYLGAGTEKIAEEVQARWPQARVVRWDRDVTGRKGSHDAILEQFISQQANVMVGTQMIAKGLDLPLVTLVGVISADVGLYLPDFRASERSFQLLTQVAGRAGRSLLGGRVILQSYKPEHYAVQTARRHDYLDFYRQELSFRREHGYPPFRRLARLVYVHKDRERVQQEALSLGQALSLAISQQGLSGVDLIGPAPCFFNRERGKYRWHIVVRAADPAAFLRSVAIPAGWRVDVDPISLL